MQTRKMFFTLILATLICLPVASFPQAVCAQAQVLETQVSYDFGLQITFQATFRSSSLPQKALLVFEEINQPYTSIGEMQITTLDKDTYELTYTHRIEKYRLRAFTTIAFHIEARLEDNQTYTSPKEYFEYQDNRFEWQSRTEDPFQVFWYEGDVIFAQNVLDVAQEGLQRFQSLVQTPQPTSIKIYIYPNSQAMQAALKPSSEGWVAGHADPDLGVAIVTLPSGPDQRLLMEQRVPHEIAHIALYQSTLQGYRNLPVWLIEGIASLSELYLNSDYRIILDNARENNSFIPMASLCEIFPGDVSSALLAYSQSASFTQFLHDTYGVSGLQKLIDTYANGYNCEGGAKAALGKGLTQLDRQWQRDVMAENIILSTLGTLLPWLTLLILVLAMPMVMLILRSKETRTPQQNTPEPGEL